MYMMSNEPLKAEKYFKKGLSEFPKDFLLQFNHAVFLLSQKEFKLAEKQFEKLHFAFRNHKAITFNLILCYLMSGKIELL